MWDGLVVLVTSRDYQLEAGDREARYVMLGNIVSELWGREGTGQTVRLGHNGETGTRHDDFITISWPLLLPLLVFAQCSYYSL